jgi:leader peptidase (prepilin peptidase)/N-methyltransferase
VEIIGVAVSLLLWFFPHDVLTYEWAMALMVYFGVVLVMDIEHRLVSMNVVGMILGVFVGYYLHGWRATFLGGLTGTLFMLVIYYFGVLFVRFVSKRRGEKIEEVALGLGDVYLAGVIGFLLGWPGIVLGLTIAILLGGFFSIIYLVIMKLVGRYEAFTPLPYGPYLVAAAVILVFFKDYLLFN